MLATTRSSLTPIISIIVAMTKQGVIGNAGKLPWHIKDDLAYFKQVTMGKPVIMGRKTFDSIQGKPLSGRKNIVISNSLVLSSRALPADSENAKNSKNSGDAGYYLANTIAEALQLAEPAQEIMIIGGAKIYQEFLPLTDKMYISLVHADYPGDVYFPKYDPQAWRLVQEDKRAEFTAQVWHRINFI